MFPVPVSRFLFSVGRGVLESSGVFAALPLTVSAWAFSLHRGPGVVWGCLQKQQRFAARLLPVSVRRLFLSAGRGILENSGVL